jgi:catechol 2,3-dioxygenase-like lactoylglutathione lyase family enzyme
MLTIDRSSGNRLLLLITALFLFVATTSVDAHEPERQVRVERFSLEVSDLKRALRFYEDVLRLDIVGRLEQPETVTTGVRSEEELRVEEVLLWREGYFSLGLLEYEGEVGQVRTGSVWVYTDQIDRVAADAGSLGLSVSDELRVASRVGEPIRQRLIEDWDGNQVYVQQRIPSEVLSGECAEIGKLQAWTVFDDRHIYISGTVPDSKYLLTMKIRCRGALHALRLTVPNSEGVMCRANARIGYLDAGLRRTCRVEQIEEVLNVDDAKQKVAADLADE